MSLGVFHVLAVLCIGGGAGRGSEDAEDVEDVADGD